ncbi:MAG TPA: ABC transporter ATP-binding protein, partial [Rubricoccaceae bacterium]|nr:ABC transporter ATP-binding protein [Rubricoccaceae bacterium]
MSGAPEAGAALTAEGVTHRYGAHVALREVTFSVAPGERFALLGPNGGGKTTLFRLAATLMRPSEGRVTVFGHDTAGAPAAVRRRLGVIFQQPALDRELTVRESLRAHAALVGVPRAEVGARAAEVLARFGLDEHAGRRVKALSGGLARRTDLARGLLHRPALLLLDEPTTGLDPAARRDLWDALDALLRRDGTTQVVATHLMDEAERCDRVGILDRGRLVALDTPDALKSRLGAETLWLDTPDPE